MARLADRMLSRRQVEGLISEGKTVFIFDGNVVRADAWLKFHPGGDKAILHMVGRDATDEVNALHSVEARARMRGFVIGKVQQPWESFTPPLHGGTFRPYIEGEGDEELSESECPQSKGARSSSSSSVSSEDNSFLLDPSLRRRHQGSAIASSSSSMTSVYVHDETGMEELTRKGMEYDLATYPALDAETQGKIVDLYRELDKQVRAAGLYNCNYVRYVREVMRYLTYLSTSLILLHYGWYKMSAFFLGVFWHQITFSAHDAGHMGITHHFHIDTCIGIFIADFCGGLSLGWWKRSHNVHHIVTNDPEHDPDIEHLPFFAVSHRFFSSLYSTYYDRVMQYDAAARILVRFQNYLYYPILCFGRFNLYRLSWEYLLLGLGPRKGIAAYQRWLEITGMVVFWYWFGYQLLYKSIPTNWDRFLFVMISHAVTMPLHVQITLSHFAMSTSDLGVKESFAQRMLRTTMDVDCPRWLDFFHGGLQFQAIHHLFPRIPRHNLRQAQQLVMEFCKKSGVPYALYGFYDGNKKVLGHLGEVGKQAKILAECQAAVINKGDYGHM
ncbi:fatty acid/sphingolipid desaturase [Choiromyces venosus 120613-1]|uniref:Delta 8-(E)-sphingolipid desaturase n=1 Tax=Choiromyces venosus 120613-1 TaxID=1336337 RepID=A0A3N4JLS9_9PEZI|nr:fatty acid/sphingolipid desaturase [Choiromyces venosus 120613-1]